MSELALLGGRPVRTRPFPAHRTIGPEEKRAVLEVLDSGVLSKFQGAWPNGFLGGPRVRRLESEWTGFCGTRHAVAVNSATSGLYAAVGAAGIGPGDEVIVSPYTMSASATCVIIYNGIPVFADIEAETYGLDPASVQARITSRTRAIVVVHQFGHPADMEPIMDLARRHRLIVIEDCAQAPLATFKSRRVGTIGDMAVFSLNRHKHIHCGEGGIVLTNDGALAERLQLIRNHGEAVVGPKKVADVANTFGFNFRPTEIEAAIAIEQLKKLPGLVEERIRNAEYLSTRLGGFPGLHPPVVRDGCTHAYYLQAFKFEEEDWGGVRRDDMVSAVAAELAPAELQEDEGPLISGGYVEPLYLQPMYQSRLAYGPSGCPFSCPLYAGRVNFGRGLCPTAEEMHERKVFTLEFMRPPVTLEDLDDVVKAFEKVFRRRRDLVQSEHSRASVPLPPPGELEEVRSDHA